MMRRLKSEQGQLFYALDLEAVVPDDHQVRRIAAADRTCAALLSYEPAVDRSGADYPDAHLRLCVCERLCVNGGCNIPSKLNQICQPSSENLLPMRYLAKIHCFENGHNPLKFLAGELGFEPRQAESESAVLPLDDSPSSRSAQGRPREGRWYQHKSGKARLWHTCPAAHATCKRKLVLQFESDLFPFPSARSAAPPPRRERQGGVGMDTIHIPALPTPRTKPCAPGSERLKSASGIRTETPLSVNRTCVPAGGMLAQLPVSRALHPQTAPCSKGAQRQGLVAEWLRSGLQIRAPRFDSGRGLQFFRANTIDPDALVAKDAPGAPLALGQKLGQWSCLVRIDVGQVCHCMSVS